MQYTEVKNPIWANQEQTLINCQVNFVDLSEEFVDFTANPTDKYNASSKEIFDRCIAGDFGSIANYEPPAPLTNDELAEIARLERNRLLSSSDWTQLPDVPQSVKNKWSAYRQLLRDIPEQSGFPSSIDWPVIPS